jgi:hypothetical protein
LFGDGLGLFLILGKGRGPYESVKGIADSSWDDVVWGFFNG